MSNSMEIAHIHNHCHLLGESIDAGLMSNQINHLMSTALPPLIAQELDRQLPNTEHSDKVYRINKLHFSLALQKEDLQAGLAGAILANRLIQALRQALQHDSSNVKCYANEEEYIGSLMADLLRGKAWSQWQYQEFSSLQHVDEDEAVIQILIARPSTLVSLLKVLHKQNAIEHLLVAITLERSYALFEQWSEHKIEEIFKSPSIHTLGELNAQVSSLGLLEAHIKTQEPLAVAVIKMLLKRMLKATEQVIDLPCTITVIAHILFIHRHKLLIQNLLKPKDNKFAIADQNLAVLGTVEQQIIQNLKAFLSLSAAHKEYIKQILTNTKSDTLKGINENTETIKEHNNLLCQTVHCAHAGLIFLLPIIVSLGLRNMYSNAQLRKALFCIADAKEDDASYAWINWLLPKDANEHEDVPDHLPSSLPTSLQVGLNKEQRNDLENLKTFPELQLARLMSMQFGVRLSGLQLSSAQYLNEQFLHVAGTFTRDDLGVRVILAPISLNIVLSMSGFSPWQQTISWLNQTLRIEVRS